MTRSPMAKPCTPAPISLTTPATSVPGENGSGGFFWYSPCAMSTSGKLSALALTRSSSWPGPAVGEGTDCTLSRSSGPGSVHSKALIAGWSECRGSSKISRAAGKRNFGSQSETPAGWWPAAGRGPLRACRQDDLADVRAAFHQAVRVGGALQRKRGMHHRADAPLFEQRPHGAAQVAGDRRLELHGARPQRRAGNRQAAAQRLAEIHCYAAAAEEGDERKAPVVGQRIQLARDVVPGDHVEYDIGNTPVRELLDDGREILVAVVDGALGAQLLAGAALLVAAGGGEHAMPEGVRHLDRGDADAAAASLHQQRLSRRQMRAVEHVAPDGEESLGQRRGLHRIQPARHGQALAHGGGAVFG